MKNVYFSFKALLVFILLGISIPSSSQWSCKIDILESGTGVVADTTPVQITKWSPRPNLDFGNGKFSGLIEHLPPGYNNAGNTQKYPLILYFGGKGAGGPGTLARLCEFFSDQETSLPWQLEKGTITPTATLNGTTYNYLVIAPQHRLYDPPDTARFPNGDDIAAVLEYVVANYRVDPARIYMTGMSAGANMVIHYASSSVERARRIAAFNTSSLCAALTIPPNTPQSWEVIADANLPGRFVHCSNDGANCRYTISQEWSNLINGEKPGLTEFNVPSGSCNYSGHNSWVYNYSPTHLINGKNLYDYFIQYTSATALPVRIKSFNARLTNGTVALDWITSSEISSKSFRVERAGSNYVFQALSTVPAAGNSNGDKSYKFIDAKPLPNLNLYRLVQIDEDGKESISEIVKVMNKNSGKFHLNVSPNPFATKLTAYLNLEKRQRVVATITDLNGRMVATQTYTLNEGASEINLPTSNLQKGMYLLKVETEQQTQIEKIIRN